MNNEPATLSGDREEVEGDDDDDGVQEQWPSQLHAAHPRSAQASKPFSHRVRLAAVFIHTQTPIPQ